MLQFFANVSPTKKHQPDRDPVTETTNFLTGLSLPKLPLWRTYGGWPSQQRKVHVQEPKDRPVGSVVLLLHGLSQNGAGIMRAGRDLVRELVPDAAIIAPDGYYGADPDQHPRARKVRGRDKSFGWFDLPNGHLFPGHKLGRSIRPSVDCVHELIDKTLEKYGIDESKLYIVGFSQGGAIAIQAAIERKNACAGVANICGPFFDPKIVGVPEARSKPPIFYGVDLGDEVTPAGLAYHAMTVLKRLKLPVTMHVTQAAPSEDITKYDRNGRPYIVSQSQPGSPYLIEHKKYYRDKSGELHYSSTFEKTGHWLNPGMRAGLVHCFRTLERPHAALRAADSLGLSQLSRTLTPRITARRLAVWWMLHPTVLTSHQPSVLRPTTRWNHLVHQGKQRLTLAFAGVARKAVDMLAPVLFDFPEQMAELGSKEKVFVTTHELDKLMGQPKKRGLFND